MYWFIFSFFKVICTPNMGLELMPQDLSTDWAGQAPPTYTY